MASTNHHHDRGLGQVLGSDFARSREMARPEFTLTHTFVCVMDVRGCSNVEVVCIHRYFEWPAAGGRILGL